MQKILRRVATAERVAMKRKKNRESRFWTKEKKEKELDFRQQVMQMDEQFKKAKDRVRDDWKLGALAPREDVGGWADRAGVIHESRFRTFQRLSFAQRNKRCEWAGGASELNIVKGDRVVLLDGPDKGRIGTISDIDEDTAEVTVLGLNKSNLRVSDEIRTASDPPAINLELPLPVSAVRLVHPLTDPKTGVTRDVIINRLQHSGMAEDRITGERTWQRVVPGLNVTIPWPVEEEEEPTTFDGDTLRIDSEKRTFVPTLLRPPMPAQVIDELRNKYSRFRTRHEPEYIARLEAEEREAAERKRRNAESMRTPLQEFHRQERANKKKKGKPRLTLEMLEKIGEVIARNREKALQRSLGDADAAAAAAAPGGAAPSSSFSPSPARPSTAPAALDAPAADAPPPLRDSHPPPSS